MLAKIKSLFINSSTSELVENNSKTVTPNEAYERAQALFAVIMRAELIMVIKNSSDGMIGKVNEKILEEHDKSVHSKGVDRYMSAQEIEWAYKDQNLFTEQDYINISWRTESLGVLLWAMNVIERMPSYDTEFNQNEIIKLFSEYKKSIGVFKKVSMRSEAEILQEREAAELWHWRANTTRLIAENKGKNQLDEQKLIHIAFLASKSAFESGLAPSPIGHDFPAFGKAYSKLNMDEFIKAMSIAMERHFALNWLCRYSQDWDETPTNT